MIVLCGLAASAPAGAETYTFYRFEASLTTDGEPVNVDIVVRCRYVERNFLGEGRSYLAVRSPYLWGVRTTRGTAVIFQVPAACGRPASQIPDNLLPVVFWAPKVDDLGFLVGYVSETTYEAKNSRLTLPKARITTATARDFAEWQTKAERNWITPQNDPFRAGPAAMRVRGSLPSRCYVAYEAPLDEKSRAMVAAARHSAAATYWFPKDASIFSRLSYSHNITRRYGFVFHELDVATGVPRKPRGGNIGFWADFRPIESWPYRQDQGIPWLNEAAVRSSVNRITIETVGEFGGSGRLYCYPILEPVGIDGKRDSRWTVKATEVRFDDGPTIFSSPGSSYPALIRDDVAVLRIVTPGVGNVERGELE